MELSLQDVEEMLLTKNEFVNEVAKRTGLNKYIINEIYSVTYELIVEKLIHNEVIELPKLGTFCLAKKNAKGLLCGNQRNMEKKCIYPLFKINDSLKKRVKYMNEYSKML